MRSIQLPRFLGSAITLAIGMATLPGLTEADETNEIIHDAEQYILEAQNGEKWALEDVEMDRKLAELREKFGAPPNIIYIMWDDTALGEVGIPEIQKIRGFETPNINQLAAEGINFMRMYSEPACTQTRSAAMTGRYAVRNGMYEVSFPVENSGLAAEEVTIGEVMSDAGYATAFYGKWHLGDTEPSYPHNQGFDETLFTPYNQVPTMWVPGVESANVITGMFPELYDEDPYDIDNSWQPRGFVWTLEGTKGGKTLEWGPPPNLDNAWDIDKESQIRISDFMKRNVDAKKPFFATYWPTMTAFAPDARNPVKQTANKNILAEGLARLDLYVGELLQELEDLGIAENTLVVLMADNGPFTHFGPRGMVETLFRGGKGDFTEGGVRVPAMAYWPGVIEPGQIVGDIVHVTDLYTTFAKLGGGANNIPTDRIVDGIDQTALFLKGDTFSRRDYVMIYQGQSLAGAVKGRWKRDWANALEGLSGAEFFDLFTDPREKNPEMIEMFHLKSMFNRQRQRHELWIKKYPNREGPTYGPALTGIENVRPETVKLYQAPVDQDKLPFDLEEVWEQKLPWSASDM